MLCYRPRGVNVLVCMRVYIYVHVKYNTECLITWLWGVFLTLFLAWNSLWQLKIIVHILLYNQGWAIARLWYTNKHDVYGCSDFCSECLAAFISNLTMKTIFDLFYWVVCGKAKCVGQTALPNSISTHSFKRLCNCRVAFSSMSERMT